MTKHSKLMKSSLAVLVAGSISFSGSLAYAENDEKTFDTVTIEQKGSTGVAVNDEAMIDSAKTEIDKLEKTETPSLLPGDFFYFAKLALEKVKLAFTMDDAKEAKLLAEYAAERLAEVEALFEDGKEEEAIEAINHAIEMIQRSGDESSHGEDEEASNDESMEESADETTDESNTEEENIETEETSNEEEESDSEEKSDEMTEMEELMSQNIIALQANLEKVKNPKAKAALQKNIEKSYMKLAEKLAKLEEKWAKKANAKEDTESDELMKKDSVTPVEEAAPTETTTDENTDGNNNETSPTVKKETEKTAPVKVKNVEKEVKKELKEQQKQEKKEAKEARKQIKNEEKQARHDVKEDKKQHQSALKQKEHQGQNSKSSKENGKGHNKD